jgi:hypothetical protein
MISDSVVRLHQGCYFFASRPDVPVQGQLAEAGQHEADGR